MDRKVIAELPVKVGKEEFRIGIQMIHTVTHGISFTLVDIYPNTEPMPRGCFYTNHISCAFETLQEVCGKRLTQEQKNRAIDAYQTWEDLLYHHSR